MGQGQLLGWTGGWHDNSEATMQLTGRAVIPQRRCRYGEVIATATASPISTKQLYAAESLARRINRSTPTRRSPSSSSSSRSISAVT